MEHTKLPWIAEDNGDISNGIIILLKADNSQCKSNAEIEANAALIVKCVNNFPKLVDALEKIVNSRTPFNQRELEAWRLTVIQIAQETLNELNKVEL